MLNGMTLIKPDHISAVYPSNTYKKPLIKKHYEKISFICCSSDGLIIQHK
ncbi:hypothetical protein HDC90_003371 [Pedobacter sp. AK013]|nr:hypothetical protein [Pedobacter sp. AK013]